MNEINRVLRRAAWRLGATAFLRGWVLALSGALGLAIVLRIAEQVFAFTHASADGRGLSSASLWWKVLYWGAGATVVFAAVWAVVTRPRGGAVARRVDEGANLREALSTALCIRNEKDPWSRATVESAARQARGVNVGAAVPIRAPRFWPVVFALALSLAVVWMAVPRMDVLGWFAQAETEKKRQVEIVNAVREVKEVQKKIEEMTAKIPGLEKEASQAGPEGEKPDPKSAEEIRKAAISDLTKLTDRLEQLKSGAQAQKLEAMQNQLKNLKQTPGESGELSKALAKGNFSQARQELEKMREQLASGEMSAGAKEKLAEQMAKMAEQVEKLAQNQDQVKKALEQAGISPEAIKDLKSAKEAIDKAQNLSAEQKQAMKDMLDAAMQSSEGMQQMAAAMQKMSEGMKSGEGGEQSRQAAEQLAQQLSEMQQIQEEMELAEATMNECQQAMNELGKECGGEGEGMGECQGGLGSQAGSGMEATRPWQSGVSNEFGMGRGGPGLGQGGRPGEARADFDLEKKKFIGAKGDGPIVSSRLVEGESLKGESKAAFLRAVAAGEQGATEAIENNTIPREYHEAIKAYFGRLKQKAAAAEKDEKPMEPAAAPARDE